MAKKTKDKNKEHLKGKIKKGQENQKLQRGYKLCANCKIVLNIHKCVCNQCGHIHNMKKHKVDIMKNISKGTPKIIRSIIQSNEFNQITTKKKPLSSLISKKFQQKQESMALNNIKKRKSQINQKGKKSIFQKSNVQQVNFLKSNYPIVCLQVIEDYLIFVESVDKRANSSQQEKITIRAFKLQNLHKLGEKYSGQSQINIIHNQSIIVKFKTDFHIISIKYCGNCLAILTGFNSICLIFFDMNQSKQFRQFSLLKKELKQIQLVNDQITQFCWLKSTLNHDKFSAKLVVGTLMGHIIIYQVDENLDFKVYRIIVNAHFEALTSIQQCPLNVEDQIIFASGSYDGSIAIWNLNQKQPILKFQASNRKIQSLTWDVGGKFILIIRDQNLQNCYLSCLYSLNNKIDNYLLLSDDVDFRLIKGENISSLICSNIQSKLFPLLNPRTGNLKLLQIQQLRKISLKRKKSKKNQILYFDYKFTCSKKLIVQKSKSTFADDEMQQPNNKISKNQKQNIDFEVPLYSSIAIKPKSDKNLRTIIYLSNFSGYLIRLFVDQV